VAVTRAGAVRNTPRARAARFSRSRRLSVFVIDGFAAGRIDQMHAAARETSHGFITLLLRLAGMIGHPALDPKASLGASVQERRHSLVMEKRPRPEPHRCLGTATVRPGPLAHRIILLGQLEIMDFVR
jgi:hypothetical protein